MADERVPEGANAEQPPGISLEPPAPQPPVTQPPASQQTAAQQAVGHAKSVTITRTVKVKLGLTQVVGILIVGLSVLAMLIGLLAAALMPLGPTAVAAGARSRLYLLFFAPGGIGLLIGILLASRPSRARAAVASGDDTGAGGSPS